MRKMLALLFCLILVASSAIAADVQIRNNTSPIKTGSTYFATTETTLVAAQSDSSITHVTLVSPITLTASRTITKPLYANGGAIITTTGYTLTLSGGFDAGDYQCFAGTGTVAITANQVKMDWFGTNETAFSAAVAATLVGATLVMSDRTYSFSSGVTVNKNISLRMENDAYISFSGTGAALTFTGSLNAADLRLNVVRSTRDWTSGNVGVEIQDMIGSRLQITAKNFEKGLYFNCSSGSIAYSYIYLGDLWFNKYGVYLTSTAPGWSNGNSFYGGRITTRSTDDISVDRYGIYLNAAGSNYFYSPIIEIDDPSGAEAYSIYFQGETRRNRFFGAYLEGTAYAFGAGGNARYNKVQAHVAESSAKTISQKIADTGNYIGTNTLDWTTDDNSTSFEGGLQEVFPITDVFQNIVVDGVGSNSKVVVPGFSWIREATGVATYSDIGNVTFNDSGLDLSIYTAIGRWVDTSTVKDFWLSMERTSFASGMYGVVIAYDSNGAILSGSSPYVVTGGANNTDSFTSIASTTNYGGAYTLNFGTGLNRREFIHVSDSVKSIWVGIRGAGGIKAISLKCSSYQPRPNSNPGYDLVTSGAYSLSDANEVRCVSTPAGGVFNTGTRIIDINAASGAAPGWVVAGRVSTFANGGEPAAETTISVDSITGISASDIIGVMITADAGGATKWWWSTVNGAPAGDNVVITHAIPTGYSVADNAKIISYRLLAMPSLP